MSEEIEGLVAFTWHVGATIMAGGALLLVSPESTASGAVATDIAMVGLMLMAASIVAHSAIKAFQLWIGPEPPTIDEEVRG